MRSTRALWEHPAGVAWVRYLLNSFCVATTRELIPRQSAAIDARALFAASFVVVSHGLGEDPILNYGNLEALKLWQMDWKQFIITPSSKTAEDVNREQRKEMLDRVTRHGYVMNYNGVRVTSSGSRFMILDGQIWNVYNNRNVRIGHAATFSKWRLLDKP